MQRRRFRCSARAAGRRVKPGSGGADPTGVVWLDLLVFVLLLGFTLLGAWRGALESGLRLAGWIVGYAAAALAGAVAADATAALLGTPAWLGMPLAGTFAFLATQILFAIAVALARRRREESEPGSGDRALGALFGAARGGLVVVLVGWLALFADALRSEGLAAGLPSVEGSLAAEWSGVVVESGAGAMLGTSDPGARAATALAAHPRQSLEALRTVLDHPRVVALERDAEFWKQIEAGSVDAALALPSARALARDAGLREQLATLGLVDAAAGTNPLAFQQAFEDALRAAAERLATLRRDPEMRALLEDPEVLGLVERGDAFGLLTHPRFQSVLRRATAS